MASHKSWMTKYIYEAWRVLDFHREFSYNETLFVELLPSPSFGKYAFEICFIIKQEGNGINRLVVRRFQSEDQSGGWGEDF